MRNSRSSWMTMAAILCCSLWTALMSSHAQAQTIDLFMGDQVPRDVRELYERGLQFLVKTQAESGGWEDAHGGAAGTGMAIMCFLASGEDPNFGIYSGNIRRALRHLISQQDAETGYIGQSMYVHGFAMLSLAECYGTVDDRHLWPAGKNERSVGQALELCVRAAVTSQKKNSLGAWRYSPTSSDADTSVSGAVVMGLLAARNAGIEVPDEAIDKAISYYVKMTAPSGQVAYSGGLGGFDESMARISICTLVYAVSRRKDLPQYQSTLKYLVDRIDGSGSSGHGGAEYQCYYQAQALFQGDIEAWTKWNKLLVRNLKTQQNPDGSFSGSYGQHVSTSLCLLAVAVNYRFLPIYER